MDSGGDVVLLYGVAALFLLVGVVLYEIIYARHHKSPKVLPLLKQQDLVANHEAELERQVADATKELRDANDKLQRLDAAKDELVSIASHQLRTPLTSVKGYLSMVLEGDAGELNDDQRKLLTEAFTSSDRMVRLIGDFLNVSRLQNGKFMIDRSSPVDLAALVTQEITNVSELAVKKNIGLAYHRPSHFPTLYLDEDKIRQVIMNYLDNAIFYSPDNTNISVRLYVNDGAAVLEVIDHGIGVPHDVQKRLFTKFFRADNARKQRPDGTGVGLFLAKQVVDGHQGKIIFSSQEGEGSTFGFRLPIKKLSTAIAPGQ